MDLSTTFGLSPRPNAGELLRRAALVAAAAVVYVTIVIGLFAAAGHIMYGAANWFLRLNVHVPMIWLSTSTPFFVLMMSAASAARARKRRSAFPARPPKRTYPLGLR